MQSAVCSGGGTSNRLFVTCTYVILVPLMLDEAMQYLENRQVNIWPFVSDFE